MKLGCCAAVLDSVSVFGLVRTAGLREARDNVIVHIRQQVSTDPRIEKVRSQSWTVDLLRKRSSVEDGGGQANISIAARVRADNDKFVAGGMCGERRDPGQQILETPLCHCLSHYTTH